MSLDWDWYQATLHGATDGELVARDLIHGSGVLTLSAGAGGFNRPKSLRGVSPSGGTLAIYFGADARGVDLAAHVVATSSLAPHAAEVLRRLYPGHGVSRADVAYDVDEPGAFERLHQAAYRLARVRRRGPRGGVLTTSTVGDWFDAEDGRTLYIGGASSELRVRVYEKGHEQRAKHPDRSFSLDWCRVEWQVRPRSSAKVRASTATPAEIAAWTTYGAALLDTVTALGFDPTAPARVPSTAPEYWLARQYGAILRELVVLPDGELRRRLVSILELAVSTPNRSTAGGAGAEHLPEPLRERARS